MKKTGTLLLYDLLLVLTISLHAEVKLSSIFSDNMVFQQQKPIRIWGWASVNEKVEVSFLKQTKSVKADKNGSWIVEFAPQTYGGPYSLQVKGKSNTILLENILIGEVWLCSGQSNMEWTLRKGINNATVEANTANYPQIRSFNVKQTLNPQAQSNLNGKWEVCSSSTVFDFSAVAYFFARKLNTELGIPVGIINSSWGGTDIETWISDEAFNSLPEHFSNRYSNLGITDFEKFMKEGTERKTRFYAAMNVEPGEPQRWFDPITDVSSWKKMAVPQLWENILPNVDGIIWFRFDITLPEDAAGKPAAVQLGPIDDNDVTWINGKQIGETEGYSLNRQYAIPENVLQKGINTIVVKVTDTYGGGGFYGKPENMYLEVAGEKYPLSGDWLYKEAVTNKQFNYTEVTPNMKSSLLYNAMINPIVKFPIKGVIWYQGENNVGNAYDYRTLFPTMINDWRTKWGYEFPFYWVQLANFLAKDDIPQESAWAELRQAQTETLSLPNTGQAVITDIGDANDIHPRNKQDVGLRLALLALNKDYGKQDIVYFGPKFKSMEIKGSKAIISFDFLANGLQTINKYGYIDGFTIAGADQKFEWAKAYIEGDKVVVYSERVAAPVAVRYSWANNPDVNLFNTDGSPAVPFKTDDWKWSTQH